MHHKAESGLSRLLYVSRNTISGSDDEYRNEINKILTVAQHRNSELGISGLLTFTQGIFAQVLEGDPQRIDELFEIIQMDRRHDDVTILEISNVEQRAFASWSMGFVGDDPGLEELFRGMRVGDACTLGKQEAARILTFMETLAKRQKITLKAA